MPLVAWPAGNPDEVHPGPLGEDLVDNVDREVADDDIARAHFFGHLFVPEGLNDTGVSVVFEPLFGSLVSGGYINGQFVITLCISDKEFVACFG